MVGITEYVSYILYGHFNIIKSIISVETMI